MLGFVSVMGYKSFCFFRFKFFGGGAKLVRFSSKTIKYSKLKRVNRKVKLGKVKLKRVNRKGKTGKIELKRVNRKVRLGKVELKRVNRKGKLGKVKFKKLKRKVRLRKVKFNRSCVGDVRTIVMGAFLKFRMGRVRGWYHNTGIGAGVIRVMPKSIKVEAGSGSFLGFEDDIVCDSYLIIADSLNNIFVTLVDLDGRTLFVFNAGMVGFSGKHKKGRYVAKALGAVVLGGLEKNKCSKVCVVIRTLYSRMLVRRFLKFLVGIRMVRVVPRIGHNGMKTKKKRRV